MAGGEEKTMPAEAEMDLEFPRCAEVPDFSFSFNSETFSNMELQIEVIADDDVGGGSLPDWARHSKDKVDEGQSIDSSSTMAGAPVITVKALHINSAILAARSTFFLKLFSNGMKETDQRHARIRIDHSEENALMELLSFMYSGKLTTIEPTHLLDILMAADKFEVLSCMGYCSQLLTSLPMTTESALLYLDHPCSIIMAAEVQRVVGAAKKFLADKYKDIKKFVHEVLNFSLAGIEAIFSSTDMQVESEDDIYYFLLKWARLRYPELKERRKIWSCHLLPLIRFNHMTCKTLQKILACTHNDIDCELITKRIVEVLVHKAYPTQIEGTLATDVTSCWQLAERAYEYKPVKAVAFNRPCPQVIVYLDLERDVCSRLFPSGNICSDWFHLAGQEFYLMVCCEMDEQSKLHGFGLLLGNFEKPADSMCLTVDFEFAARTRSSGKFVSLYEYKHTFTSDLMEGCIDLFGIPWSTFIADDDLFIDGVLHLRADLTVVEQAESQA